VPIEALIGAIVLLIVLGYVFVYWQSLTAVNRYDEGFVIDTCPVCRRGTLQLEQRQERILGIPRARRTVRCDSCRSVLRETGMKHWRYAVDRIENAQLHDRYNGQIITDEELVRLSKPPRPTRVDQETAPPDQPDDHDE